MPAAALPNRTRSGVPDAMRIVISLALPLLGAPTVAGTSLGKELILCAALVAGGLVGFRFEPAAVATVVRRPAVQWAVA